MLKFEIICVVMLDLSSAFWLGGHRELNAVLLGGRELLATRVEGEAFPKTLIDPAGVARVLAAPPQRIVSTVLAGDEILADLVTQERVVGVTYLADDPSQSSVVGVFPPSIPRIGVGIEGVLALEPDLVLVASYTRAETVRMLVAAGVPVLRLGSFRTFSEVASNLRLAASVLGNQNRAEAIVEEQAERIALVRQRVAGLSRPRVLVWDPTGYTKGPGTLMDEIIALAGGVNVVREAGITGASKISSELAIGLEPDVILLEGSGWESASDAVETLRNNPLWQHVPAVASGRVYAHRGPRVSSVTQRRLPDLEAIVQILHPELGKS